MDQEFQWHRSWGKVSLCKPVRVTGDPAWSSLPWQMGRRASPKLPGAQGAAAHSLMLLGRIFSTAECSSQGVGVTRSHLRGEAARSVSHSGVLAPPSCGLDPGPAPPLGQQENLWCLHSGHGGLGSSAESVRSPHPNCDVHPCHRPPEHH